MELSTTHDNIVCSNITKKVNCKGSCKWDDTDQTSQKCIKSPVTCSDWNRVDCSAKCVWDTNETGCTNKLDLNKKPIKCESIPKDL